MKTKRKPKTQKSSISIIIIGILAVIFLQNFFDSSPVAGAMGGFSDSDSNNILESEFSVYCWGSEDPIKDNRYYDEGLFSSCSGDVTSGSEYIDYVSCSIDGRKVSIKAHLTDAGNSFCENQYDKVIGKGKITLQKTESEAIDMCSYSGQHTCDYGTNKYQVCYKASDGHYKYRVEESCRTDEVCTLSGCKTQIETLPVEPEEPTINDGTLVQALSIKIITPSGTDDVELYDVVTIEGTFYAWESGTYLFEGALPRPTKTMSITTVTKNSCNPEDIDYPSVKMKVNAGSTYKFRFNAVALKEGKITPQIDVWTNCYADGGVYIDSMTAEKTISVSEADIEEEKISESKAVVPLSISVITEDGSNFVNVGDTVKIKGKFHAQKSGTYVFEGALPRPTAASIVATRNVCNPTDLDYPCIKKDVIAGIIYEITFEAVAMKKGKTTPQISVWTDCTNEGGKFVSSKTSAVTLTVDAEDGESDKTDTEENDDNNFNILLIIGVIVVLAGIFNMQKRE